MKPNLVISVTPTTIAEQYTAEDQIGGIQTLTNACRVEQGVGVLETLTILDKAKVSPALVVFFFNALPTVASVDGGTITITDAEMAKCVGAVVVGTGDWSIVAGSAVATVKPALKMHSATVAGTLYAVAKVTGTPTFGSTSDLVYQYTFSRLN